MSKIVNPRDILLRPVISEKSLRLADDGKYTFIVAPDAHKTQIRQAVEATFNVKVKEAPQSEKGIWTFGMRKGAQGWRITGWAWTPPPSPPRSK